MEDIRYLNSINQTSYLSSSEVKGLSEVTKRFAFRSNTYYLSLIDWDDPDDPIRKIVIPQLKELEKWGKIDPSCEDKYTVKPGVQHKYSSTALLLVTAVCASYCRFCFRKRLFMDGNHETDIDISEGLEYIRSNTNITNVIITGGDPLIFSTAKLKSILYRLTEIPHVKIIRIGTKIPAFNPHRIIKDPSIGEMLSIYTRPDKKIYCMLHFNHPRELTKEAVEAINILQSSGLILTNQTPLLKGVNDDPKILSKLFNRLSYIGVPPYYVFIVRPAIGNKLFCIPIETAVGIYKKAVSCCSGLAKRSKLVMSHTTGKIEIIGKMEGYIYFKYYRTPENINSGKMVKFESNPRAFWLDDYENAVQNQDERHSIFHTAIYPA